MEERLLYWMFAVLFLFCTWCCAGYFFDFMLFVNHADINRKAAQYLRAANIFAWMSLFVSLGFLLFLFFKSGYYG